MVDYMGQRGFVIWESFLIDRRPFVSALCAATMAAMAIEVMAVETMGIDCN